MRGSNADCEVATWHDMMLQGCHARAASERSALALETEGVEPGKKKLKRKINKKIDKSRVVAEPSSRRACHSTRAIHL